MPDFSRQQANMLPPIGVISTLGWEAGSYFAAMAGADSVGGGVNLGNGGACFCPFTLNRIETIYGFGWSVSTNNTGNLDVGVYDSTGAKVVSTGSTALGTVSLPQVASVSATTLLPGNYFLAAAQDNTSGLIRGINMNIDIQEMLGVKAMSAAAFVLPSTATFAKATKNQYPHLSAFLNATF